MSNASVSYPWFAGAGHFWLISGMPMNRVALAGLATLVGNFVQVFFLQILNIRDITDA